MRLFNILLSVAGVVGVANALPKVTRGGRFLYSEDGSRFYIKGIAYQPAGTVADDPNNSFPEPDDFTDPLANTQGCMRDIPHLKSLTINAIRVYSVDSSLNHDACMQALSAAGIYTIIDLSLPVNGSINRLVPSWDVSLLNLYLTTAEAFMKYDNVLAFNIGNEVVAQTDQFPNATAAAPYIKAAARDVKAFLKSKNSEILVGYASTDGPSSWRGPLANYLGCDSEANSVDIYGLNNYEWCGDSDFADSYATSDSEFANLNIPAYFSEFGCVDKPPRLWTEVQALFGPQMTPHWSGGIAFSYFPAQGNFGMVTISSDNQTVTLSDDFNRLQAQYNNVTFINSPSQSAAGQTQYPACAPPSPPGFLASDTLPPTPNQAACQCLRNTAFSCVFKETNAPQEPAVVGSLLDTACSLLGSKGQSCNPIGSDGATGTYGELSFCDPVTKLDYTFSLFYDITNRNPQSCDFSGNATIVPTPPTNATAAASSCLSTDAVFTPSAPSGSGSNSGGSSSTPKSPSPSSGKNAADALTFDKHGLLGLVAVTAIGCVLGTWTVFA